MWLFLLLPWIWIVGSYGKEIETHHRIATGDAFKVKCDMLPYRTYYDGVGCFFAIKADLSYDRADGACKTVFEGARFYSEKYRERILQSMFLDASDYHDPLSTGQQKNVLCMMQVQYSCDFGDHALPGRCVWRSDGPLTWREASNYCRSRGGSSVVIHNSQENKVYTDILQKGESGWLLPGRDKIWSAEEETIDYWNWFFVSGYLGTPENLRCSDDSQHAILSNNAKASCAAFGLWKVDHSTNKNIALCIKQADCPLCPPPPKRDDTETTVEDLPTITTTTPKPTTTTPCLPQNDPPHQQDLWDLKYYYNWGRILHGFAATPAGYNMMQGNGVGYDGWNGAGSLGGTISDAGFARLKQYCNDPNEVKHIVPMWFTQTGVSWQHVFYPSGIYVGYVSRKAGACGSKWPVRRWGCMVSADAMYAGDLNGNTWYRGRTDWVVHFWLWDMNEGARNAQRKGPTNCNKPPANAPVVVPAVTCKPKSDPPRQKDLWDLKYYYNWGRILHGFAATTEGYNNIQRNGIGYDCCNGAGSMGGTLSDDGYKRLGEFCSDKDQQKQIVKMWFSKQGLSYQHVFEGSTASKDVYVGYVALKQGMCGSKWPVKRWSCLVSADMMYAGNLDGNTWYRGRQQNGGQVHFWLWEMNEGVREQQRTGKC